jgi:hypothetical protein
VAAWSKAWVYCRSPAETVGSIPAGCIVNVVCCQVEVSATSWPLVQRSPTDSGASSCDIKISSRMRMPPRWAAATGKIRPRLVNNFAAFHDT